jgi:hypothetical protein
VQARAGEAMRLFTDELEAMAAVAVVDAYDAYEQLAASRAVIVDSSGL